MRRREFLATIGGAVGWPVAARTQQLAAMPIVGVLTPHLLHAEFPTFFEKLGELGYEDGRRERRVVED